MTTYECYVEVYRITEWRDGCVYKTERVGFEWVEADTPAPCGFVHSPPSTTWVQANPNLPTIRRKKA